MNPQLKTIIFSYIEAGIAAVIVLAENGGAAHPADLLWAFVAGFAGPIVKWLNPLDKALGFGSIILPDAPKGNAAQTAVADILASEATSKLELASAPALDAAAKVVAPVVDAVAPTVEQVVAAVTPKQ